MEQLLIATKNKGKILELEELLPDSKTIDFTTLADFRNVTEVKETGRTFAENAALKASSYSTQTGCWTLADDSGLEVASLGNAPGVYSARYAGENATDEENVQKLLSELQSSEIKNRIAQFVCVICVSDKKGKIQCQAEGFCEGRITLTPSGTNGFGYDPVFIPLGFDQTFGELSGEIKREISHRSNAVKRIIKYLSQITLS